MTRSSSLTASALLLAFPLLIGATIGREKSDAVPARGASAEELGLPSPEALGQDLLAEFQRIYNSRDSEAYVAMFDPWVFSYEFSPLDKGWGGPDAWDYVAEVRTAQKMFTDPKTTRIDLKLVHQEVSAASSADAIPMDVGQVWKVTASVYLTVDRKTSYGWGGTHYQIHGQRHEFYFRRGTEDEGRSWRIVYWRDLTGRETAYSMRSAMN